MRILFVIRSLDMGGAERQCCGLAVGLRRRGHQVKVLSLASGGVLAPDLVRNGIGLRSCAHRGPRDLLRSGIRLRALVQDFEPEVIYSFMSVSNILCAAFLPRSLRCRLVWGIRASWVDHPGYGAFTRIVLDLERRLASWPRLIISNSLAGANYHVALGYPRSKIKVVENVIDSATFDFSHRVRSEVRSRLGIASDRRIILIVARIDPIKGYDTFLSAAVEVSASREDVDFWCVGGGDAALASDLRMRTKALNIESRVKWHGEVRETSNLVALLNAADLAVSASMAEGYPNSIAESLACGLRVVGTDAGDSKRIIGESGETVPVGDAGAMAGALLRQLDRGAARESVRADYLARFAPDLLFERHESLLLSVANPMQAQHGETVAR